MKRLFFILLVLALQPVVRAQSVDKSELARKAVENVMLDAVSRMSEGNVEDALKVFGTLKVSDPLNDALHYYIGLCNYRLGNFEEARASLEEAVRLAPSNNWYKESLASAYGALRQGGKMAEIYEGLLKDEPNIYGNAYVWTLLGDKAMDERKDSLAMSRYEQALALDPGYSLAVLGQSEIYRMRSNYPAFFASLNTFVRAPEIMPQGKTQYLRQLFKYVDGNFFRAWHTQLDSLVTGTLGSAPADSSALHFAGEWFYGTGRPEEGKMYFRRWAGICPESTDARMVLVELAVLDRDYPAALLQVDTLLSIAGRNNAVKLKAYSIAGDIYYETGSPSRAFKSYDRALKIDSGYVPVLNNYAYYLSLRGERLRKAAAMSRITIEKEPDNATYLDTYGWILHLLGKDAEAKPHFKRAMIYGGKDSAVIMDHYADVLEALGDRDLAKYYRGLAESKEK